MWSRSDALARRIESLARFLYSKGVSDDTLQAALAFGPRAAGARPHGPSAGVRLNAHLSSRGPGQAEPDRRTTRKDRAAGPRAAPDNRHEGKTKQGPPASRTSFSSGHVAAAGERQGRGRSATESHLDRGTDQAFRQAPGQGCHDAQNRNHASSGQETSVAAAVIIPGLRRSRPTDCRPVGFFCRVGPTINSVHLVKFSGEVSLTAHRCHRVNRARRERDLPTRKPGFSSPPSPPKKNRKLACGRLGFVWYIGKGVKEA